MSIKQKILDTPVGSHALAIRDRYGLLKSACFSPEQMSMVSNDYLAAKFITRICSPGKAFIDIGAHIGSIVSEVLRYCTDVNVIAVEAIPEKAENLRKKFSQIEVLQYALGESEGDVPFYIDTKRSGYSSLLNTGGNSNAIKEITVPLTRLDTVVQRDDIDAIKIDVEGAELGVIIGGKELINQNRPIIMFESAPSRENDQTHSKERMWQTLRDIEYCIVIPNRLPHNDAGISLDGFLESHLYPRRTTNYFAVPNERREEYQKRALTI